MVHKFPTVALAYSPM